MFQIIQTAAGVATPLAFLGLVVAMAYFAYTRRLKHAETMLQTLPPDDRATAADEYLTRYGIHGRDLAAADKVALIRAEMKKRHQRSTALLYLAAIVFVVCFGVAVFAYVFNATPDTSDLIDELENRAKVVVKTMNDKKDHLESLKNEGAPTQPQIDILSEAIDRFTLLHHEYINALRQNEFRLSHERLAKVKDFLGDQQLLNVLGIVYKPVYSEMNRIGESGTPETVKTKKWVAVTTTEGENVKSGYLSAVSSEAKANLPGELAIPE